MSTRVAEISQPETVAVLQRANGLQSALAPSFLLYAMLAVQFAAQVGLLFLGDSPARVPLRISTFAASLLMLAVIPRTRAHPAMPWAVASVIILLLGFVHPERNTALAGIAQIGIYISILAPLWWVPGLRMNTQHLRTVIIILWCFYTASAIVGMLQTFFPGRLQPALSAIYEAKGEALMEGGKITLSSGARMYRPMGLTDTPGGAALGGMYAFVLGLGLLLAEKNEWFKITCFCGMLAGLYCILLSQVRSILVMVGICSIAFLFTLAWRLDWRRFHTAALVLLATAFVGAGAALAVGGESVVERLKTLVEEDPATVYYLGRGYYLHRMINEDLWPFRFGAGLGRWGMINHYFGDPNNDSLWAEVQWQAWLYDGGIPLMITYTGAVIAALLMGWRIAMRCAGIIGLWGAVLFAYNVGAFAITFNYPIFLSQSGMEFWLLNASLFAAARNEFLQRAGAMA